MKAIIKIYATLIKNGIKTIEEIPEKDRELVETALAELYKSETLEANIE